MQRASVPRRQPMMWWERPVSRYGCGTARRYPSQDMRVHTAVRTSALLGGGPPQRRTNVGCLKRFNTLIYEEIVYSTPEIWYWRQLFQQQFSRKNLTNFLEITCE